MMLLRRCFQKSLNLILTISTLTLISACQSVAGPEGETHIIRGIVANVTLTKDDTPEPANRIGTSVTQLIEIEIDDAYPALLGDPDKIVAQYVSPTQRAVTDQQDIMVVIADSSEFVIVEFAEPLSVNCFATEYENLDDFYDNDEASIGTILGRSHCYASDR